MSSNLSIPLIDHPLFNKNFSLPKPQLDVTFARREVGHPLAHVVAGASQLPDVGLQLLYLNLLKRKIELKMKAKRRNQDVEQTFQKQSLIKQ